MNTIYYDMKVIFKLSSTDDKKDFIFYSLFLLLIFQIYFYLFSTFLNLIIYKKKRRGIGVQVDLYDEKRLSDLSNNFDNLNISNLVIENFKNSNDDENILDLCGND